MIIGIANLFNKKAFQNVLIQLNQNGLTLIIRLFY